MWISTSTTTPGAFGYVKFDYLRVYHYRRRRHVLRKRQDWLQHVYAYYHRRPVHDYHRQRRAWSHQVPLRTNVNDYFHYERERLSSRELLHPVKLEPSRLHALKV